MAVIITVRGPSGSGKTTLIEQVIPRLTARGLRVGVVKHAHEGFNLDQHGKDSQRCWGAGAHAVLVAAPQELFVRQRLPAPPPATMNGGRAGSVARQAGSAWSRFSELRRLLPQELDCVFIEGFTRRVAAIDVPVAVQVEIAQEGVRLNGQPVRGDHATAAIEEAVMSCLSRDRVAAASREGRHGRRSPTT